MSTLTRYIEVLNALNKQTTVNLHIDQEGDHLRINGVDFYPTTVMALLEGEFKTGGVLVKDLPVNVERICKAREISFLTQTGRLWLFHPNYRLSIELGRAKRIKKKKPSTSVKLTEVTRLPRPTLLLSPNGFDILDVLFRLSETELNNFKSALSFAHEFRLNQSKLSLMMTALRARSLPELKNRIKALPDLWWETALRYPMTRKGLTPFFEAAKPYTSLNKEISPENMRAAVESWLRSNELLLPGPVEASKELAVIRDTDIYLWGTPAALQSLKIEFKLIPAKSSKDNITWQLASPRAGLERESILSPLAPGRWPFALSSLRTNIFRSLWDLSFGGARLSEIQILALRKVLDGI